MSNTFYYTHAHTFDQSTFADSAYYDEGTKRLFIETSDGTGLLYKADFGDYQDFILAPSAGQHYQRSIKGNLEYLRDEEIWFTEPAVRDTPEDGDPAFEDAVALEVERALTPGKSGSTGREYTIVASFDSFEAAYTVFSYAETTSKSVSLSVDND